jgi:SCY1-like protein 2
MPDQMAALDVFRAISGQVDSDFLAMDVLPILWQFSLGPLLNLPQFQAYMTLIKSMSARVESEQTRKLQELGANSATATTRNEFMSFGGPSTSNGFDTANGGGEADFETLVRGGQQSSSGGTDMLGGDPWANGSASASSSTVLPSHSSNNRSRTSNNASPAATFSWSTPPVTPLPPPSNTSLSAPKSQSRAITPDNTFNTLNSSFPAMAPSNPGIGSPSFAPPQQQSKPTMSMHSMASPTTTPSYGSQSTGTGGIDWSKASSSVSQSSNTWGTTSTPNITSSLSNFSIAPPPSQVQSQTSNQSSLYSSFSIPPPKPASTNSFSIAPPPSMGMGSRTTSTGSGMNMNSMSALRAQTQGQQQQRPQQPQQPQQQNPWNGSDSLI